MRKKIILAVLMAVALLGLSANSFAYSLTFSFVSASNSADTATFTISDPSHALTSVSGYWDSSTTAGVLEYQTATLTATGTWASYAPAVTETYSEVVLTQTAGAWSVYYAQLYGANAAHTTLLQVMAMPMSGYSTSAIGVMLAASSTPFVLVPNSSAAGLFDVTVYNSATKAYEPTGESLFLTVTVDNSAVPVPAAAWLLGSGLLGLAGVRRKIAG